MEFDILLKITYIYTAFLKAFVSKTDLDCVVDDTTLRRGNAGVEALQIETRF